MDVSFIDSSTTSSNSLSITPPSATTSPTKLPPESGTSAVTDPENGVEAESSKKLPSSKYKGVVPQPNGRWGAQIYEKHQRVWLGTFNTEQEAAIAYDTAVQRFRGPEAVTNLKHLSHIEKDEVETNFLNSHSKAEIVDMLRKHTYNDELEQCRRNCVGNNNVTNKQNDGYNTIKRFSDREQLFEKTVTPSDVGKLNRLVVPKQHAEKHFPLQSSNTSKGILVNFEDMDGKVWRFRYSYWNSSQSYVLTKGWSRFVKEKNLQAGDVVSFQRSDNQLYIDWKTRSVGSVHVVRLFGVNICEVPVHGGKRIMREVELELKCRKKQRVIDDALIVTSKNLVN